MKATQLQQLVVADFFKKHPGLTQEEMRDHCFYSQDIYDRAEAVTLREAGIEEDTRQPLHGMDSVHAYINWMNDGEDSRYETELN